MEEQPQDLITATDARELLGVGPAKFSRLIKERALTCWRSKLDARVKLFSRAEVESLKTPLVEKAA